MILPIYAFGQPVLKQVAKEIDKDFPDLHDLIDNMYETMENASGVGLAAPQIGKSIRLFVVDSNFMLNDQDIEDGEEGIRETFINAEMLDEFGEPWDFEEGCLSIPKIREKVSREDTIKIRYYNRDFELIERQFTGITARVIQHEYDHIEGILFTDKINPLKKQLIKNKLQKIKSGKITGDYKMKIV